MRVGDLVIVADLGEMKLYRANPRDLEAEAGLKPHNIKLDLVNAIDYVEAHWKIKDIVTDEAGRFRGPNGSSGGITERHGIEAKLEEDVIRAIAQDIAHFVHEYDPPRYFLALPEPIFKRVWSHVESLASKYPEATRKLFRYVEEDLTKVDRQKLPEIFKERGRHF
ncbi:MAG: hypothetical protein C6I00_04740 [Nitratiruptor sp.]|nr:hypothetical protein [Nitratiruptor sp.]NPA84216.1 host attachment protein [Campylobacterota bacterium]